MKFKCLIFSVFLFVGCLGISNCGAKDNNDGNIIPEYLMDTLSSYECRIGNILTEQEKIKGQVENLSAEMETFRKSANNEGRFEWLVDKLWKLLIVLSFVLAITALVYAHRILVNNKRFIKVTNKRIDVLKTGFVSLKAVVDGASNTDFQKLKDDLSNFEKRLEELERSINSPSKLCEGEIELSSLSEIKMGYFRYPESDDAGNVYFKEFLDNKEGIVSFRVETNGDNATFEPISLKAIKYDITDPAIDFSGDVNKANAQGMTVREPGTAVRQGDGRWLVKEKTKIILK